MRLATPPRAAVLRCGRPLLVQVTALALFASFAAAAPKARIEPPVIELGTIQEGNSYERYITLTNAGDGVLVLEDVKTSCGCTAAAVDAAVELKAGESQKIRITFDSRRMDGPIAKKITVTTNDPENKHQMVTLKADVHKPVRWEPKYLRLDRVNPKDDWSQTVQLQADRAIGLKVKGAQILGQERREGGAMVSGPSELFDLKVGEPYVEGDRDIWDMTVTLRPGAKPQKLSETLAVWTSDAERDTLKMSIRGEIVGRIAAAPTFAVLKMVDPGERAERDVTLTARDGTFRVLKAEVVDSPLKVEVLPQAGGKQVVIRIAYVGEEAGMSGVRQLRVTTDDPEQGVIEIPVRYQTRGATVDGNPAHMPTASVPGE